MTFLPIVERELRVRARLRSTYRFRLFAAVGSFLIVMVLLLGTLVFGPGSKIGTNVFVVLATLAFAYCLTEGARNTADSLSREKREGTLGLLFLTDLKGYDVVLGKLAATSINSFYGLLGIFPALAIPLVLGGLTGGEFWRHVLGLMNALFFSLSIGLFVSAASRDERHTWSMTSFLVLILTAAPPFLLYVPASPWAELTGLSPFTAFLGAFDGAYSANPEQYWESIRTVQGVSWLALIAASLVLPRRWQDRPAESETAFRSPRKAEISAHRRAEILDVNPALWLSVRAAGPPIALWALVVGSCAEGVIIWLLNPASDLAAWVLFGAMITVHLLLSVWVASEACHSFGAARDSGALDLLLCTPLTTRQIVNGYLGGIKRMFFRPVAALLGIELILIFARASVTYDGSVVEFIVWIGVMMLLAAAVLELQAAATFGLWMGLTTRRSGQAVTKTVLFVIGLPLVAIVTLPIYPILAVVKNVAFTNYAYDQLRRRLRAVVTNRFDSTKRGEFVTDPTLRSQRGQLPPVLTR